MILHKLLGTIELRPGPDKSVWAEYELCPTALLKSAGTVGTAGTTGSGGRISPRRYAALLLLPLFAMLRIAAAASEPASSQVQSLLIAK